MKLSVTKARLVSSQRRVSEVIQRHHELWLAQRERALTVPAWIFPSLGASAEDRFKLTKERVEHNCRERDRFLAPGRRGGGQHRKLKVYRNRQRDAQPFPYLSVL